MKQTAPVAAMSVSKECLLARDRLDSETRCRERVDGELDRWRTRERLEATLAGLGELEYLRQRQELLVRSVLARQERAAFAGEATASGAAEDAFLNSEEKLLEENILLLRKQLNCLRRRDAGLISQLQELDRQISDLRLDSEKVSIDHLETDSRPSSGFYELSDGTSGSLSNSSNSVFSECLSSCRSSSCFCNPLDTSLGAADGQPRPADELVGCADCEGRCEDQSSVLVRRSFSAPYSPSVDGTPEGQSKYQCDLVARNGSDVYRYPSPLHAVAVQSPMFFQSLVGHFKEDGIQFKASEPSNEFLKPEQAPEPHNVSWPASYQPSNKRLDHYILGLLQRRAQPVRTNKPRTSINTDPAKSILRQGSICVRQTVGAAQGKTPDLKASRQACLHSSATGSADVSAASPMKQWPAEATIDQLENGKSLVPSAYHQHSEHLSNTIEIHTNSLSKKNTSVANKGLPLSTVTKDCQEMGAPHSTSSPKDSGNRYLPMPDDRKGSQSPRQSLKSPPAVPPPLEKRPPLELRSLGSSSQSQDEGGRLVSAQYIPAQRQAGKLRKGGRNVKIVKVKGAALKTRANIEPIPEVSQEKPRVVAKKCRFPDDIPNLHKASKKSSSKTKRVGSSHLDSSLAGRYPVSTGKSAAPRHHGHGREVILTKPKYKRADYRRYKTIAEVPYEEAMRKARRRQKREVLGQVSAVYLPPTVQYASPYSYVGSDSEYSAECASLFHSTVLDTSEDEQSNYTTNCFGDSESSLSEVDFVGESTTSSDSDESGGLVWPQFGQSIGPVVPSEVTSAQAKAFVKIKASHNLKKKILRFRSGSLKLMTTV
ncbi:dapper homolog 1 isoform X1 [Lepisosteus oculatus]|nr:PREDICTED: dapper homolog 1 isoform X1 [Lepisosteus oculatus]